MPELSLSRSRSGIGGTEYSSYVRANPFWKKTSAAGIPTTVMRWPVTFPAEKVDKERMVIINEKGGEFDRLRRFYDWIEDQNFGWDVRRAVKQRLFPQSSLLLPVIGSDASLKAIDRAELLQHYQQYYLPANMSLIAVGDFAEDQLNQLVGFDFRAVKNNRQAIAGFNFQVMPVVLLIKYLRCIRYFRLN